MAREEEVTVSMKFDDDYTEGVKKAADETDDLSKGLDNAKDSSVAANVEFLATMEALDKVGGAVAKIRGGLEELGIANEATIEGMRKIEGVANLVVGSSEIAIVAMFAWKRATDAQKHAMFGLALAAASAGFAYAAMNAESQDQKAVFSALTGITAGLAAAKFTLAAAEAASWTASSGPLAPMTAAAIVAGLVAVAAGLATFYASTKGGGADATAPASAGPTVTGLSPEMAVAHEQVMAGGGAGVGLQTGPSTAREAIALQTGADTIKEAHVVASGAVRIDAGETITAERPAVPAILQEGRKTPLIGEMNVTFVGAFNPFRVEENRMAATAIGEYIQNKLGGNA